MGAMVRTILVIDDHAGFRGEARRLLEKGPFSVVGEAADAASGLLAAKQLQPDVVLLDVVLPDSDGFAVLEALLERPRPASRRARVDPGRIGLWRSRGALWREWVHPEGPSERRRHGRAPQVTRPDIGDAQTLGSPPIGMGLDDVPRARPGPGAHGLSDASAAALVALAFLVAIGAELLSANDWRVEARPSELGLVTDALLGLSFLLVGIVVWRALPGVGVGRLLYACGLVYFLGNLAASPDPLLHHVGMAFPGLWLVGVGALVLAYPSDRLERRQDQVLAIGAFAFMVITGAAFVTQLDPTRCLPAFCPANPFRVDLGVNLAPGLATVLTAGGGILLAIVTVQVGRRWLAASPSSRRALAPLWLAAGAMGLGMAGGSLLEVVVGENPASLAARLLPIVVAVALGFGVLRARMDQASVGDLVVRLGSHPADVELAEAVARAVGDPTLVLAVPDADGQLVDLGGQPVAPPAPDRRITRVEAGDELLAVLIHDVGLDANPGLIRSVAAATRLALENRRLTATVQHQLEDVRASRARIVEASDAERERIERNLHDGAQQRLVTLALRLRMLAGDGSVERRPLDRGRGRRAG